MIYLLFAMFGSAVLTLNLRYFQNPDGNRFGILLGNYLTCTLIAFIRVPDKSLVFRSSRVTNLCGLIAGVIFVVSLVVLQTSIRLNGATLTAAFSKLGLVVSLAVSILAFGERPGTLQYFGVILVITALILINSGGEEEIMTGSRPVTLVLLLTMLLNGTANSMAKVFEQLGPRSEDELYYFYLFGVAAVLTAGLAIYEQKKHGKPLRAKDLASGITVGIPNYCSSFLLLPSLVALPSFIVYPVFSTGALLIVTLVSTVFFKEKHTNKQKLGILLVLAALVLLNLR